jgi:tetratricopeptide (TPR) repeat protein
MTFIDDGGISKKPEKTKGAINRKTFARYFSVLLFICVALIYAGCVTTNPTVRQRMDAQSAYHRGVAAASQKNYDGAIREFSKAIELDPNYADAYTNRGIAYAGKSDYDRAIADYNQAIWLDPNYADVYNNRGLAYSSKGDSNRAIADYTEAIRLDPKLADA